MLTRLLFNDMLEPLNFDSIISDRLLKKLFFLLQDCNVLYEIGILQLHFTQLRFKATDSLLALLALLLPLFNRHFQLLLLFLHKALHFIGMLAGQLVCTPILSKMAFA